MAYRNGRGLKKKRVAMPLNSFPQHLLPPIHRPKFMSVVQMVGGRTRRHKSRCFPFPATAWTGQQPSATAFSFQHSPACSQKFKEGPPFLNLATLSSMATGSPHFHWADEQMVLWHWQTIGQWLHLCDFCDPPLKMSDLSMEVEKWAELDEVFGHLSPKLLFSCVLMGVPLCP